MSKTSWKVLMSLVVVAYVFTRVWHLNHFALESDEAFSVQVVRTSWHAMMQAVLADSVHPPLFYVLLKLWASVVGTSSVFWMRLLPCTISLLIVIPLWRICSELALPKELTATVFTLVTFNQILILTAQQLRMYSLLTLLSATSLWLFMRALTEGRDAVTFGLLLATNWAMIYTHYYGLVYIGAQFAFMGVWAYYHDQSIRKLRMYVLSLLILSVAFTPWTIMIAYATEKKGGLHSNLDWIPAPSVVSVVTFFHVLSGPLPLRHTTILGVVLFTVPVILALRTTKLPEVVTLGTFALLPVITAIVSSYILPFSVFQPRYLVGCAIPYLLMVTISVYSLTAFKRIALATLLSWTVLSGVSFIRTPSRGMPWDKLAGEMNHTVRAYTFDDYEQLPLAYYGVDITILPKQTFEVSDRDFVFVYRKDTWNGKDPKDVWRDKGYEAVASVTESSFDETIIASEWRRPRGSPDGKIGSNSHRG